MIDTFFHKGKYSYLLYHKIDNTQYIIPTISPEKASPQLPVYQSAIA